VHVHPNHRLLRGIVFFLLFDERVEHVDGQREDDGRVLLGADRGESLQVAELQGVGRLAHDVGGLFQLARGVHFTLGGDHLSKRSWIRLRSQAEFQK